MSIRIIVSLLFKFVAFLLSGAILKPYRFFVRKNDGSVKKVEVQEALLPLNRRRDYCRSPYSFRVTPAGR